MSVLDVRFLVDGIIIFKLKKIFFSTLLNLTAFWPPLFLMRSQLLIFLGFLISDASFFSRFQDFLVFDFYYFYHDVSVVLANTILAIVLQKFWELSNHSYTFQYVFHLFLLSSGILITFVMVYLMVSQNFFEALFTFLHYFFFFQHA